MTEPLSDAEIRERELLKKEKRREYYRENCERLRAKARERYATLQQEADAAKKKARLMQFSKEDRRLLRDLESKPLGVKGSAIADHILRTVFIGKPFKGWRDDARDALSSAS